MTILAVDDEKIALEGLERTIKKVLPDAQVHSFWNTKEALEFIKQTACDIAFLDIEMREMDGITLAKRIKGIYPKINIIFTTGYSEYAGSAFSLHASGYVTKPITTEKIQNEIEELRYPVQVSDPSRLRVKTFGNFEVYADGKPLVFRYNKSKELFAYLIDRNGSLCTNNEIMNVLWEEAENPSKHKSYMKNARADMIATLEAAGHDDVLVRQRGAIGVIPDKLECDYYDWLAGKASGINAYRGEYMMQYSWSEVTHGALEERL